MKGVCRCSGVGQRCRLLLGRNRTVERVVDESKTARTLLSNVKKLSVSDGTTVAEREKQRTGGGKSDVDEDLRFDGEAL
jgi:hypothetical protein